MKKMWKVTVNGWGWDMPMTYFAESREEAQRVSEKHPASDGIRMSTLQACRAGILTADVPN